MSNRLRCRMRFLCSAIAFFGLIFGLVDIYTATASAETPADSIFRDLQRQKLPGTIKTYDHSDEPTVYLTFDDGPSSLTPKVLDILKKEGVPAAFFVLGEAAQSHPEMIKRIVQEGHALGNHTYNHRYEEIYREFTGYWEQIQRTEAILSNIAGERPRMLRAPGGTRNHFDAFYFYYLEQAGYQVYDWNIDSGDSRRKGVTAAEMIANVKKGPFPRDVHLLLHDGAGHAETVKALPDIIRLFKAKGYRFAALDPSVRPVVFVLGDKLPRRNETMADFRRMMAAVAEHSAEMAEVSEHDVRTAAQEAADALARQGEIPLHVVWRDNAGDKTLELQQYSMVDGEFYVSLRTFAEWLGGSVGWDGETKTATLRFGRHNWQLLLKDGAITDKAAMVPEPPRRADMSVDAGRVMIPLRLAAVLFDCDLVASKAGQSVRAAELREAGRML